MAGFDIDIDLDALEALGADLTKVATEFDQAHGNAADAAEATGHDGLRHQVIDFADTWNIKRGAMVDNITSLQGIIQQIAESFTQVDTDLAKSFDESPAATAPGGRPTAV